jgi:CYTH domain-containing protein
MIERRFLIAPSFARLIRKELGAAGRIVEGYFAAQSDRNQVVRVERDRCELVLMVKGEDGGTSEERAEVPRSHAEALIDVVAGTVAFDRVPMPLGRELLLDTFVSPAGLSLVTVQFGEGERPEQFYPPQWFGREVTADEAFQRGTIALNGAPEAVDVPITDAGLDELLNVLERQAWRAPRLERRPPVVASLPLRERAGAPAAAATPANPPTPKPVAVPAPAASAAPARAPAPEPDAEDEGPMLKLARALAPQTPSTSH